MTFSGLKIYCGSSDSIETHGTSTIHSNEARMSFCDFSNIIVINCYGNQTEKFNEAYKKFSPWLARPQGFPGSQGSFIMLLASESLSSRKAP